MSPDDASPIVTRRLPVPFYGVAAIVALAATAVLIALRSDSISLASLAWLIVGATVLGLGAVYDQWAEWLPESTAAIARFVLLAGGTGCLLVAPFASRPSTSPPTRGEIVAIVDSALQRDTNVAYLRANIDSTRRTLRTIQSEIAQLPSLFPRPAQTGSGACGSSTAIKCPVDQPVHVDTATVGAPTAPNADGESTRRIRRTFESVASIRRLLIPGADFKALTDGLGLLLNASALPELAGAAAAKSAGEQLLEAAVAQSSKSAQPGDKSLVDKITGKIKAKIEDKVLDKVADLLFDWAKRVIPPFGPDTAGIVHFDVGSATIPRSGLDVLERIVKKNANDRRVFLVTGHVDDSGPMDSTAREVINARLAKERAVNVASTLAARMQGETLVFVFYDPKSRPVVTDVHAREPENRRVKVLSW